MSGHSCKSFPGSPCAACAQPRPRLDLPDGAGVTEPTLDEIGDRLDALGFGKLALDARNLGFCTAAETPVLRHLDALVGHLERRSKGLALAEAEIVRLRAQVATLRGAP